jgi:CelD/BcsL family acetyltransferase involved in cellulose biosynthesis
VRAFVGIHADRHSGWDVLHVNDIPEKSPNINLFRTQLKRLRCAVDESEVPCAFVELPATWEEYLRMLKPRMRSKIRSLVRRAEDDKTLTFDMCASEDDLHHRLQSLFLLHNARWRAVGKPGVFESDAKTAFYAEMGRLFLERGWLKFYSLATDDGYVAHQYCFERNGTIFLLQEGYDTQYEQYPVGNVLRAHVMRDCIERGVSVYDFLGGVTRHKLSWGASTKKSCRIATASSGILPGVKFSVPRLVPKSKKLLKRHLTKTGIRRFD